MERPKYLTLLFIDNTTIKIEKGEIEELNEESYYNIPNEELFVKEFEASKYVSEISSDLDLSIFKENKWIIEIEYWEKGTKIYIIDEQSQAILFSGVDLYTLITDKIVPYVLNNKPNII